MAHRPGMLDPLELTGRTNRHVRALAGFECSAHASVCEPFLELRRAAARDGLDLCAWSAFRNFDDQLRIWNAKFRGERALYAPDGTQLVHAGLDERALVEAILRWSALPGASRHHWGTDIDVVDRAALPPGYRVKLMPDEFEAGGVFEQLGRWLDRHLESYGFFRPYAAFRGGVEPEPWHLSYAPIAVPALAMLSPALLAETIDGADVLGKNRILAELPAIFERYVANVAPPPGPGIASGQ